MMTTVETVSHWIDGRMTTPAAGRTATVWNPATGEPQAKVSLASVEEVDAAVASAKKAFESWRSSPLSRRAEILFRMRALVDANRKKLAERITLEHGKTLADARGMAPNDPGQRRIRPAERAARAWAAPRPSTSSSRMSRAIAECPSRASRQLSQPFPAPRSSTANGRPCRTVSGWTTSRISASKLRTRTPHCRASGPVLR